jgi:hypothetical protein
MGIDRNAIPDLAFATRRVEGCARTDRSACRTMTMHKLARHGASYRMPNTGFDAGARRPFIKILLIIKS